MSHEPIALSKEQTEAIKAAATNVPACWRERFLASVADRLLSHEPDRVYDSDVIAAITGVTWALNVGLSDDDDY